MPVQVNYFGQFVSISAGFVRGVGGFDPPGEMVDPPPNAKNTNWGVVKEPPQGHIEKLFCFLVIETMQHAA